MSDSVIIGVDALRELVRTRYPYAFIAAFDADYNIPTDESFLLFLKELSRRLFELYGDKWQEYFDCDNFVLEALALASRKHWTARQNNTGSAQGVSIGGIVVTSLKHALCVRVRSTADGLALEEFEPQNRQSVHLTPDQCASVSVVFFF